MKAASLSNWTVLISQTFFSHKGIHIQAAISIWILSNSNVQSRA